MTEEKYKNRYRIASARAIWWSYDWAGAYFITICTKNRRYFFGHVDNNTMHLSPAGELAHQFWFEIPDHAHNVELGAFQVMPNHIHGILILRGWADGGSGMVSGANLDSNPDSGSAGAPRGGDDCGVGRDKACLVSTGTTENVTNTPNTKPSPMTISQARFQNQGKNTVSSIIGGYKSVVTKNAHRAGLTFDWQSRFHDHIIRNDGEYQRINDYIESNPKRWKGDRFFSPS